MENEIVKEYSNSEMTIIWKPKTCIHSAECVKRLPEVYKPNEKPWIQMENAGTEALKTQIDACPSGALTYRMSNQESIED
ncbi:MAG: (4Fe-4S)-binding protein, partial [Bacteroidia bacterium]|nr:(4Fe-4S)-binding protein [Bacteroidia bacterium]